ncbi:MAG: hypothetical protein CSA32_01290 [Desulfobulbus propionicus]|nr:MAG: hypothetical protein CSA32_01290 [Desulfobulbus propionicus]
MTEQKILGLEDLQHLKDVDIGYGSKFDKYKRSYPRITADELREILDSTADVHVEINKNSEVFRGSILVNVSAGGMLINSSVTLPEGDEILVRFVLGNEEILVKAVVLRFMLVKISRAVSLQFVDLQPRWKKIITDYVSLAKNTADQDKKQISWDDIPSIKGLELEKDFNPLTSQGKRRYARIGTSALHYLFEMKNIPAKVSAANFSATGWIMDISEGGIAIVQKKRIEPETPVRILFHLARHKIVSKAVVKTISQIAGGYKVGMQFIGLSAENKNYINGIYASTTFHKI